jgi:hypothetical protein
VIHWLTNDLDLPEYADEFEAGRVTGKGLLRIAASDDELQKVGGKGASGMRRILWQILLFLQLGITNALHRRKLKLRCTDLVLFGPPKTSMVPLLLQILVAVLVVALISMWAWSRARVRMKQQQRGVLTPAHFQLSSW